MRVFAARMLAEFQPENDPTLKTVLRHSLILLSCRQPRSPNAIATISINEISNHGYLPNPRPPTPDPAQLLTNQIPTPESPTPPVPTFAGRFSAWRAGSNQPRGDDGARSTRRSGLPPFGRPVRTLRFLRGRRTECGRSPRISGPELPAAACCTPARRADSEPPHSPSHSPTNRQPGKAGVREIGELPDSERHGRFAEAGPGVSGPRGSGGGPQVRPVSIRPGQSGPARVGEGGGCKRHAGCGLCVCVRGWVG
jgi:hypothetical protein